MNVELFWSRVKKTNSCWFWTGALTDGYGRLNDGTKTYIAHKVAYELSNPPVPKDMEIDHLCRNRHCVNPDHMEVVDHKTNVRRGNGFKHGRSQNLYLNKKFLLYIHHPQFKSEEKKSELVNKLLEAHYSLRPVKRTTSLDMDEIITKGVAGTSKTLGTLKGVKPASEMLLCKNGHPLARGNKCMGKNCKFSIYN